MTKVFSKVCNKILIDLKKFTILFDFSLYDIIIVVQSNSFVLIFIEIKQQVGTQYEQKCKADYQHGHRTNKKDINVTIYNTNQI